MYYEILLFKREVTNVFLFAAGWHRKTIFTRAVRWKWRHIFFWPYWKKDSFAFTGSLILMFQRIFCILIISFVNNLREGIHLFKVLSSVLHFFNWVSLIISMYIIREKIHLIKIIIYFIFIPENSKFLFERAVQEIW